MGVVEFENVVWKRGNDDLAVYIPADFGSGFWRLRVGGRSQGPGGREEKTLQSSLTKNPRVTLSPRASYMRPHVRAQPRVVCDPPRLPPKSYFPRHPPTNPKPKIPQ